MNTRHPVVGIDIGKTEIFVGWLPEPAIGSPRHWKSTARLLYTDRRWWLTLLDLLTDDAIIAAEPTGHHLLAPIANLIYSYQPAAQLWQVDHAQAERYRASFISAAKNDRLDAIALTLIARDIAAGQPPLNVRPYNFFHESAVQRLRMLVNRHVGLTKEATRLKNRLHVLTHSLWPSFAGSLVWRRAALLGTYTPAQVKALAAAMQAHPSGAYIDGRVRAPLLRLAADLPDIDSDPAVVAAILDLLDHQAMLDQQLHAVAVQLHADLYADTFRQVTHRWKAGLPGASDIYCAALHVAALGRTLELSKDQFKAAVGVSPTTSISGDGDKTRTTRRGYQPARVFAHMWTMYLVSPSAAANDVRTYYQASEARSFAAAKNKLARVLWGVAHNPSLDTSEEAGEYPPAEAINQEET